MIDNSLPVYEFEIRHEAEKLDLTNRDNISKFIDNCLIIIQKMKKESEKQVYLSLVANLSGVPRETITRQLNLLKNTGQVETKSQAEEPMQVAQTKNYKAEQFILASVLHKKPYATGVESEDFVNNNFKSFYEYLKNNNFPMVSSVFDSYDVDQNPDIKSLIDYDFSKISNPEKEFAGCLNTLELDRLIAKQNQINAQIQNCTNEEVKLALIKRAGELSKQINEKREKNFF